MSVAMNDSSFWDDPSFWGDGAFDRDTSDGDQALGSHLRSIPPVCGDAGTDTAIGGGTADNHPGGGASVAARVEAAALSTASPHAMAALARLDPDTTSPLSLLRGVLVCQRLASWAHAVEQSLIAAFARPGVAVPLDRVVEAARWCNAKSGDLAATDRALDTAEDPATDPRCRDAIAQHAARFAAAELGAALHLSPLSARMRVDQALFLQDEMPATLVAERKGEVDPVRVRILAEAARVLSPAVRQAVEARVLASAGGLTASRLRAVVTRTILHLDPDGAADRARTSRKNRDVYSRPEANDLATVSALLPADKAATMMWLLNTMADAAAGPADHRGIGERRADALTDIFDDLVTTGVADIRPLVGAPSDSTGCPSAPSDSTGCPSAPGFPGAVEPRPAAVDPDPATCAGLAATGPSTTGIARPGIATRATGTGTGQLTRRRAPRCDQYRSAFGPTGQSAPGTCLTVYLTAGTLAGAGDVAAELAGYGPITAELARTLASRATSVRCMPTGPVAKPPSPPPSAPPTVSSTHPPSEFPSGPPPMPDASQRCSHPGCRGDDTCGGDLDRGQEVYRPSQKIVDHVLERDQTCRFPGCRMPAARCDLDHQIPYGNGGSTCPCNLRPLCRAHHLAKTFAGWTPSAASDGSLVWTSPLGLHYTDLLDTPRTRLVDEETSTDTTPPTPSDDSPPF